MESAGINMEIIEKAGYTIPTIEVNCKYKSHVTSGDIILIKPKMTEYNGVRMKVTYEVVNEKTGSTVIEAYTKHCFTNRELKPINMKKNNEEINKIFVKLLSNNE